MMRRKNHFAFKRKASRLLIQKNKEIRHLKTRLETEKRNQKIQHLQKQRREAELIQQGEEYKKQLLEAHQLKIKQGDEAIDRISHNFLESWNKAQEHIKIEYERLVDQRYKFSDAKREKLLEVMKKNGRFPWQYCPICYEKYTERDDVRTPRVLGKFRI
ncbi:unnamed protein product [Caenorhabditis brenneri]